MTAGPPVPPSQAAVVLTAVAHAALQGLPSAVAVSVTLVNDFGAATVAASSPWASALEQAQYDVGSGPSVDSAVSGATFHMADAATESRWPAYVAAAVARGARSSLSVPIPVDEAGVVGSLNAFALGSHGFTEEDTQALTRWAGTAAAALTTDDVASLAGRFRAVVDQARGIVMTRDGCTAAQALATMQTSAQESGRTLRDVAGELCASADRDMTRPRR